MLSELVSAGAAAVVGAMSTDAWGWVKGEVARLFGKGEASRVAAVERRLEASKAAVDRADGDPAEVARVEADWRVRLADLLEDSPDAESDLRALVETVAFGAPGADSAVIMQWAEASDDAQQAVQGQGVQVNRFGQTG